MDLRFDDTAFRGGITAANTGCGTVTVDEQAPGGGGGDVITDNPLLVFGSVGVLVLIIVALLVI